MNRKWSTLCMQSCRSHSAFICAFCANDLCACMIQTLNQMSVLCEILMLSRKLQPPFIRLCAIFHFKFNSPIIYTLVRYGNCLAYLVSFAAVLPYVRHIEKGQRLKATSLIFVYKFATEHLLIPVGDTFVNACNII